MDVKTICLGVLTFGDSSGYDIKKYCEESFSYFFAAGYGSIYPALAELTRDGLVDCRHEPQDGKPDRKVYRLTDDGRRLFLDTLATSPSRHKIRSEFLVCLYFAHLLSEERLDELLTQRLAEIDDCLELLGGLDSDCGRELPPGVRFVGGFGRAIMQAARDYIVESRDDLLADLERPRAKRA